MTDLADDLRALVEELERKQQAAEVEADEANESDEHLAAVAEANAFGSTAARLRALLAKHDGAGCPGCGRTPDNPTPLACQTCRRDPYR